MALSNTDVNIRNGSGILHSDKNFAAETVLEYARLVDRVTEKQVIRKVDLTLMPFMWIEYGPVLYDKVQDERHQF